MKNIVMAALLLSLLSGCTTKLYPKGFWSELTSGQHWDCEAVKFGTAKLQTTEEAMDALEYCTSDPMRQISICDPYGSLERFNVKTGQCEPK